MQFYLNFTALFCFSILGKKLWPIKEQLGVFQTFNLNPWWDKVAKDMFVRLTLCWSVSASISKLCGLSGKWISKRSSESGIDGLELNPAGTWGQFHQPTGIKRKCAGAQHLTQKDAVQFHQLNCAQLYWSIELENLPNLLAYALRWTPVSWV